MGSAAQDGSTAHCAICCKSSSPAGLQDMLSCFRKGARRGKRQNSKQKGSDGEASKLDAEPVVDVPPVPWPWPHVDFKGNVDLMPSHDVLPLRTLGIPARDLRLLLPAMACTPCNSADIVHLAITWKKMQSYLCL
jgi:hypothetical protein